MSFLTIVDIHEVKSWPDLDGLTLGGVSGVAVDSRGNIHVFHRGERAWNEKRVTKFPSFLKFVYFLFILNSTKISPDLIKKSSLALLTRSLLFCRSFDANNNFKSPDSPIKDDVVVVFDASGHVIRKWGSGL